MSSVIVGRRKMLFGLAASMAICSPRLSLGQAKTLRVRTSNSTSLANFDGTRWTGYEIEMLTAVLAPLNLELEPVLERNWVRAMTLVENGKIDGITQVSFSPERVKRIKFHFPLSTEIRLLLSLRSNEGRKLDIVEDLLDVPGHLAKTTGVTFNCQFSQILEKHSALSSKFIDIPPVPGADKGEFLRSMVEAIYLGRYFGYALNKTTFDHIIENFEKYAPSGAMPSDFVGRPIPEYSKSTTYFCGSLQSEPSLSNDLAESYRALRADGKFSEIWHRYMGEIEEPPFSLETSGDLKCV